MDLGPWEIAIIAVVILVLFGSAKLPNAARSLGRSMRIFKSETKGLMGDDDSQHDTVPARRRRTRASRRRGCASRPRASSSRPACSRRSSTHRPVTARPPMARRCTTRSTASSPDEP